MSLNIPRYWCFSTSSFHVLCRDYLLISTETEILLQKGLNELLKGRTSFIIAHRLSTIKNADNIVVLKNGAIVAQGTQEQLLEKCPLYQDMWRSHIGAKNWAVSTAAKEA